MVSFGFLSIYTSNDLSGLLGLNKKTIRFIFYFYFFYIFFVPPIIFFLQYLNGAQDAFIVNPFIFLM